MLLDLYQFGEELAACGVTHEGTCADGTAIRPSNPDLLKAVANASGKRLDDPATVALKNLLGEASPEWTKYLQARKVLVAQTRREQYDRLVDKVFFDLFFDASSITDNGDGTVSIKFNKAKLQELAAIRQQIKTDNPFPA